MILDLVKVVSHFQKNKFDLRMVTSTQYQTVCIKSHFLGCLLFVHHFIIMQKELGHFADNLIVSRICPHYLCSAAVYIRLLSSVTETHRTA